MPFPRLRLEPETALGKGGSFGAAATTSTSFPRKLSTGRHKYAAR
jgi:hypothetical protein